MGDPLKKVHPGDPLRISAATFNTLIDVARDYQADKQNPRHAALDSAAGPLVYWPA